MGKFSWDLAAILEYQSCDAPSPFCPQQSGGLEFKIVENVVKADRGGALSLPSVWRGLAGGLDLAVVYERRPDEP